MDNYEIAEILKEIALYLEFQDDRPFRAIAYRKAANRLETLDNFDEIAHNNSWNELQGIGKEISKMISIIIKYGHHPYLDELKRNFPEELLPLTELPRLGMKKIKFLYLDQGIKNLDELERACKAGKISSLRSFGPISEGRLLKAIEKYKSHGKELLWEKALRIGLSFQKKLSKVTKKIELVGDLRRKLETINKIEIVATANSSEKVIETFLSHSFIRNVIKRDKNEIQVFLKQGIHAHLHLVSLHQYPFALLLYTGSEKHLKELQREKGFLNLGMQKNLIEEDQIYQYLQMQPIMPELREGLGEIQAAKLGKLPNLIQEKDIRGIFHCHTIDSDGKNSLEEMVNAAQNLGLEYIGISDHSKSSSQAHGLSEERLYEQIEKIRKLNRNQSSFRIFSGLECDVLKDGTLDFSDEVLKKLDFVIVSIHRYFQMEKKLMTQRLMKAIENPYSTMIGHLTGRLLRYRDPYEIDVEKIIDACIANHKIIELNAYPNRLDMDWRYWQKAKEKGLKCCINPDAHSITELENYRFGVNVARKGWLEKGDVINTMPLKKMKTFLKNFPRNAHF